MLMPVPAQLVTAPRFLRPWRKKATLEEEGRPGLKIAILSDIHANMEALESIHESFDEMWVLGDLVNYGPEPGAVVDFVRAKAALVVAGNHDHATGNSADPQCSPAFREMARQMQAYTETVLDEEQKAYLRSLPATARRAVDGCKFLLCHATPREPLFKYLPPEPEAWRIEADAVDADVLLVGHTHLPFDLKLGDRRVVNPGSVGQPKHGQPEACYAIWRDGVVELKSAPYRVDETVRKLMALLVPLDVKQQLAGVLRNGRLVPRDESRTA
jgi:protein phosphatase